MPGNPGERLLAQLRHPQPAPPEDAPGEEVEPELDEELTLEQQLEAEQHRAAVPASAEPSARVPWSRLGDRARSLVRSRDPRLIGGVLAIVVLAVVAAVTLGGDDPEPTDAPRADRAASRPEPSREEQVDPVSGLPPSLQPAGVDAFADQRLAGTGNGQPVPDRLTVFTPVAKVIDVSGVSATQLQWTRSVKVRPSDAVTVEGVASSGDRPSRNALVTLVRAVPNSRAQLLGRVRTDAAGRYRLQVPAGSRSNAVVAYLFANEDAPAAVLSERLQITVAKPKPKRRPAPKPKPKRARKSRG